MYNQPDFHNIALGRRYTKPGLKAGKKRAHHKCQRNIAMTDDGLPSSWIQHTQSVIAILFVSMVIVLFRLQSGLSIFLAEARRGPS